MVSSLSHAAVLDSVKSDPITEPVISEYFKTINSAEFEKTAALFAPHGEFHTPFTPELIGHNAIALYLSTQCQEITITPHKSKIQRSDNGTVEANITGTIATSLFRSDASWQFSLNTRQEILCVKVKFLTSVRDLLGLNA